MNTLVVRFAKGPVARLAGQVRPRFHAAAPRQSAGAVTRVRLCLTLAVLFGCALTPVLAIDPPHAAANLCGACHLPHVAPGPDLTTVAGNVNLCISCHQSGGTASTKPFATADQALPWPGLTAADAVAGTSHRWDASAAGHLVFLGGAAVPSTGTLTPMGTYTGPYPKTYTITIATTGTVGSATFNWVGTTPGGGSGNGLSTAPTVPLELGVSLAFADGPGVSFQAGDQWKLYVRSDLAQPTNTAMLAQMVNGVVACSTCHNQHSQALTPFDTNAPAYGGPGTGAGRHFMRISNDQDQMCYDCHAARNVTNSLAGSHPVGIRVPADSLHKAPAQLPLEGATGNLGCLTCHKMHFSPANAADLQRLTNQVSVCTDCHLQSDTTTPAAHFATTNSSTLWPGGKFGSLLPARTNLTDRGSCANCHPIHGWPNATNTVTHYPKLLADYQEALCYTCHGTTGPATKQVQNDFAKLRHHPVVNAQQRAGRTVECTDCHNAHIAQAGGLVTTNVATALRNRVTNPLKGVAGVAISYTGVTNFQTVSTNLYTAIAKSPGATYEYQICFRCHSGYAYRGLPSAGLTPVYSAGTATFTANSVTVTGSGTSWNSGMVGMWIARANNYTDAYRITAVASTTSLTITPAYSGPTGAGLAYGITAETDLAQEFNPNNKSGHPIVTGLDNYPNSTVVGGKRGLLAAAMKAPWATNLGQQTMMCLDCHNTDAASPAAQGPHGSAAQFMLRGANAANWPNVVTTSFTSSWCANCHNNSAGTAHTRSNHSSRYCYECHIIIPHGGKMSRLMADRDGTMPARYAYNGYVSNVVMYSFTKNATGSYSESNCRTSCGDHATGSSTSMENW